MPWTHKVYTGFCGLNHQRFVGRKKNGAAFDGKNNNFFELSMEVEISCSGVSGMGKIAQIEG